MISSQFILTLAVFSIVLFIILSFILMFAYYNLYEPNLLIKILAALLLVLIFAWVFFGTFLALNAIWDWGLVK